MADNVIANPGSGGAVFATDDIGGVNYPRTKIALGADGEAQDLDSGQQLSANSLPVVMASDQSAIPIANQPSAANGLSIFRSLDLDEGAAEVVKASAGAVFGVWVTNRAATTRWIKLYNATSATVGTTTPVITIGIPGNATDNITGNFGPGGNGIQFSTGICVGCSTGFADNDTGAPSANDVICNIFYK